ncbi:uncharacterized protein BXZ73DRAFT_79550 [Epithele typhae]|uniref:uncharacterized protein n=1 Tax=Epithele typhae TaxID=378194 RepID=UPI002008C2A1|nr:uncharacterized protein BXZ73DRAFT_79550 [Epithele typhae]KAH9923133.1 hypothetical protein BXZ73DRAFT_79550 [Epithele typhae]
MSKRKLRDDEDIVREIRKSARQRGVAAPYIRTSLSPEVEARAERRRRVSRVLREDTDPLDVIELFSDMDDDTLLKNAYASDSSSECSLHESKQRVREALGGPVDDVKHDNDKTSSRGQYRQHGFEEQSFASHQDRQAPPMLLAAIEKLKERHPTANVEPCYTGEEVPRHWKLIATGPGSLAAIPCVYLHIKSMHADVRDGSDAAAGSSQSDAARGPLPRRRARSPLTSAKRARPSGSGSGSASAVASPATAPKGGARTQKRRKKLAAEDPVEAAAVDAATQFCADFGMEAEDAERLRSVGLKNEARVKAMGTLSEEGMGMLMEALKGEGMDFAGRLLVREGLVRRAAGSA